MSSPFLGMIMEVPFNFAPRGWAFCQGQLLPISQNDALFALIGTTFGGDGQTTFALPDLRGRVALSAGQGAGLTSHTLGEQSGTETVTLITTQIPTHNHTATVGNLAVKARAKNAPGNTNSPVGSVPATEALGITATYSTLAADADMATGPNGALVMSGTPVVGASGGNQPHENIQPYLTLNYCIALEGIFPSRN